MLGNITRAAEKLNTSQSSVSRHIFDLEHQLGCQLFLRAQGGITLTEQGRVWFDKASKIFEILEDHTAKIFPNTINKSLPSTVKSMLEGIVREFEQSAGSQQKFSLITIKERVNPMQEIKILTTDFPANHIIIPVISNILLSGEKDYYFVVNEISKNQVPDDDTDIYFLPFELESDQFEEEKIHRTGFSLYASSQYIERAGVPKNLEDCENHKFIYPGRADVLKNQLSKEHPIYRENNIVSDSLMSAFKLGELGVGIIAGLDDVINIIDTSMQRIDDVIEPVSIKRSIGVNKRVKNLPIVNRLCDDIYNILNV